MAGRMIMTWQVVVLNGWFASLGCILFAYHSHLRDVERKRENDRWWAEFRRDQLTANAIEREASDRR